MNFKHALTLTTATALGLNLGVVDIAQAVLLVNVTGISGSGQTTWVFSGSSTASSNGVFDLTTTTEEWSNVGDYVADVLLNGISIAPSSGSASITNSAETRSIGLIGIDYDGNSSSSNNDDFGIAVANTPLNITTGDTVSWTGTLILPLDITQFNWGTYGPAQSANLIGGLTDIQLTFNPIPEPTSIIGLLVAGASGLALRRRKV